MFVTYMIMAEHAEVMLPARTHFLLPCSPESNYFKFF